MLVDGRTLQAASSHMPFLLRIAAFALIGTGAGELLTGKDIIALAGLVAGILIAFLSRAPAMRKEKRDAQQQRQDNERLHTTDQANVFEAAIETLISTHNQEKAYYRRIIAGYRRDARKYEIMRELARRSKHNVIAELQNAYARLRIEKIDSYSFKTIAEICGKEDEEIDRIIVQSIDEMEQGTISGGQSNLKLFGKGYKKQSS